MSNSTQLVTAPSRRLDSLTPPDRSHVTLALKMRVNPRFGIEQWLPIPGLAGYEVSSLGGVRSVDRVIERAGRSARWRGRQLQQALLKNGYLSVGILGATRYVHHLVCNAFHGPCPPGMERRHLNGSRTCNWAGNLAYGTPAENCADTRRHGRAQIGERHYAATLTMAEVAWAREHAALGHSRTSIAAALNQPVPTVRDAVLGKSWAHCPVPPVRCSPAQDRFSAASH